MAEFEIKSYMLTTGWLSQYPLEVAKAIHKECVKAYCLEKKIKPSLHVEDKVFRILCGNVKPFLSTYLTNVDIACKIGFGTSYHFWSLIITNHYYDDFYISYPSIEGFLFFVNQINQINIIS